MKKSLIKAQSATALAIVLAGAAATAAPSVASVLADRGSVVKAEEAGSTATQPAATTAQPAETNAATTAQPATTNAASETNSATTAQPAASETAKPAETTKPSETAKPAETTKPAETAKPADQTKPAETAKSKDKADKQPLKDVPTEFKAADVKEAVASAKKLVEGYEAARKKFDVPASAVDAEKEAATAVSDLKEAAEKTDATVESINTAYNKAVEAIKKFSVKLTEANETKADKIDTAKLQTAIKKANNFVEAERDLSKLSAADKATVTLTIEAVKAEIAKAETTLANKDAKQDEVDKAAKALTDSVQTAAEKVSALVTKDDKADHKAELKKEVEAAKAALSEKDELSNVTSEAKAKYDAAKAKLTDLVSKAEALLAKKDATDKEAEDLLKEMTAANKAFKTVSDELKAQPSSVKADKDRLQKLITDAETLRNGQYDQTKLDEVGKTKLANALEALGHAITDAKSVMANEKASDREVAEAHTKLGEQIEAFKAVAKELGIETTDHGKDEPKQAAAVTGDKTSKSDTVPLKSKEGVKYANTGEASGIAATLAGVFGLLGTAATAFLKRHNF